jgi:hypothetical protein
MTATTAEDDDEDENEHDRNAREYVLFSCGF